MFEPGDTIEANMRTFPGRRQPLRERDNSKKKSLRNLRVLCASAVYMLFRFLLPQSRRGRGDYAEFL
jgi:hypothetical protein